MQVFRDERQLYKALADFFVRKAEAVQGDFCIALSGGSTPKGWLEYLATHERTWKHWSDIRFFWGDERCVEPDHQESNYGMAKRFLFDQVDAIEPSRVHRIQGEIDPFSAAKLYSRELNAFVPRESGVPKFDMVLLGLGTDGHTASLFPGHLDLWSSDSSCVVTQHPVSGQKRVSLSGAVINNATDVVFLVQGESKADVVRDIMVKKSGYLHYPAAHVRPVHGTLHWFTDVEAAKKLPA